jgi:DNA-binding transcriptional ArsR family regulator
MVYQNRCSYGRQQTLKMNHLRPRKFHAGLAPKTTDFGLVEQNRSGRDKFLKQLYELELRLLELHRATSEFFL